MTIDENIYECPCGYGWDKSKVVRYHFCPNCGRAVNSTEQEPCDAVSRKEVMTKILALLKTMCGEVDRMPSVIPQYTDAEIQKMQELEQAEIQKAYELGKAEQPKMGRWKRVSMDKYVQHAMAYYRCSECGKDIIGTHNYCPSCGAKMQEVQK